MGSTGSYPALPTSGFCVLPLRNRALTVRAQNIELRELGRSSSHFCQPIQVMGAPECLTPQPMQPLDDTVALGFADRQEDRFDADVQTQAHKGAKHSRHFVAPLKAASLSSCNRSGNPSFCQVASACARTR